MSRFSLFALFATLLALPAGAAPVPKSVPQAEWPMFGGTPARNMANFRDRLPRLPAEGPEWGDERAARAWEAEWVLWKAELGSRAFGGPVVAGGKVFVGTNNVRARNPRDTKKDANGEIEQIDMGVLMCFDQKTGTFLWQAVHDKLPGGIENDWPREGLCSTPTVVGACVYYVSNRCTVVCLDVNGFADGNQGFQNERYRDATDADVIWEYDMIRELGVHPHSMSSCAPLVVGDRVFVCTSNGVDGSHEKVPSPDAPSLICLDRRTGKLLWKDASPGKNILHGQWSSPSFAAEPVPQVIHGQGDGWLRAFDPATGKLLWKFDGNRKGAKYELGGTGEKMPFVAAPAVYKGRVIVGTGDDPEHNTGIANLWCVDLKKAVELGARAADRDVSPELVVRVEKQPDGEEKVVAKANPASALVWVYGGEERRPWAPREFKFGRTLSTVAVADDVVYAAELHGILHCLNANTGEPFWQFDTKASIWGSPYFVDDRVLVGTDAGDLFIFRHHMKPETIDPLGVGAVNAAEAKKIQRAIRKEIEAKYLVARIELPASIRTTPVVVNGVLYLTTETTLYALGKK